MLNQPLNQALTPKKSNLLPALLLILGLVIALSAATYGYIESRRTEKVIIAVRSVPFGQQLTPDDLGTIELPLHRPIQLAGIGDPALVVGKWAAREIGPNDVVQPGMLLNKAPDQPVYPSGQQLDWDTVPVPFSTTTIGPLTHRDFVNIGFNDPSGDPHLCVANGGAATPSTDTVGAVVPASAPSAGAGGQTLRLPPDGAREGAARRCGEGHRLLADEPYQAHAIWALQAAQLQLWGERYGATSDPLPSLDRMDASQFTLDRMTMTVSDTLKLYASEGFAGDSPGQNPIPGGASGTLPGSAADTTIPGQAQPATPAQP
jgi:hypothetical protein